MSTPFQPSLTLSPSFKQFLQKHVGRMGPLGHSLHRRSYARTIETDRGGHRPETWSETAYRVAHGNLQFLPKHALSEREAAYAEEEDSLRLLIDSMILVPAGRHLRQTGAPSGTQFTNNCHVSVITEEDPAHHFVFLFNGLMQGGGVGSNYSNHFLDRLPTQQSYPHMALHLDQQHPDYYEVRTEFAERETHNPHGSSMVDLIDGAYTRYLRVSDSREGWGQALRVLLEAHWNPAAETILFNLSDIRPKGSPIKRFGGTASGPKYLIEMLVRVSGILKSVAIGERLTSTQVMSIDHAVAQCVISGNVRRSARMSIKHWRDHDIMQFIVCKDDTMSHWSTNISVEVDDDFFRALDDAQDDFHKHAWQVFREGCAHGLEHGEPGFWNSSLSQVGEREKVVATNPCVTGDTWITTTEGAKQVRELVGRPFSILTSLGAYPSTQEGFWSTGVHPVLRLTTRRGYSIRCTENHRIRMENGEFRKARDIQPEDPIALEDCRGGQHTQPERECDLDQFSDAVLRVEALPPEEVFDCTIPEIHVYPSNGFLSHNCGEEVMAPHEACCLGHLNLYRLFLYEGADRDGMIDVCWRLLARYLLRSTEGDTVDAVQRATVNRQRRLGAGFFGFVGMLALLEIPYSTCYDSEVIQGYLTRWYSEVRQEATRYAKELHFADPVKVTTLAPTGTISKLTESPPSAQALIAREFLLRVRFAADDPQVAEAIKQGLLVEPCIYSPNTVVVGRYMRDPLIDHLYSMGWSAEKVQALVPSQDELSLEQSMRVQAFLQKYWADNAISFTHILYPERNLPTLEECLHIFKEVLPRIKGTTVMKDLGRPQSPFTRITREEYEARTHAHNVGQAIDDCLNGVCGI